MILNKLYIKRFTHGGFGSMLVKQTLYERIRQWVKGKRYTTIVWQRCTSIDKAADMIRNIGYKNIIDAEWFDGQGNSIDIVRKGKTNPKTVKINTINKTIYSIK